MCFGYKLDQLFPGDCFVIIFWSLPRRVIEANILMKHLTRRNVCAFLANQSSHFEARWTFQCCEAIYAVKVYFYCYFSGGLFQQFLLIVDNRKFILFLCSQKYVYRILVIFSWERRFKLAFSSPLAANLHNPSDYLFCVSLILPTAGRAKKLEVLKFLSQMSNLIVSASEKIR